MWQYNSRQNWFEQAIAGGFFKMAVRRRNGQWEVLRGKAVYAFEWETVASYGTLDRAKEEALESARAIAWQAISEIPGLQYNKYLPLQCFVLGVLVWALSQKLIGW